jgi:hypothetical protein
MDIWWSRAPDGREIVIRREGGRWKVRCGNSRAESDKLDEALIAALRSDPKAPHQRELHDLDWIRRQADAIEDPEAAGS